VNPEHLPARGRRDDQDDYDEAASRTSLEEGGSAVHDAELRPGRSDAGLNVADANPTTNTGLSDHGVDDAGEPR
jgi:hypothetical protein